MRLLIVAIAVESHFRPAIAVGPGGQLEDVAGVESGKVPPASPTNRLEAMLATTRRLVEHQRVLPEPPAMHTFIELERAHQADQGRNVVDPHDVIGAYATQSVNYMAGDKLDMQQWSVVVCGTHNLAADYGDEVPSTRVGCTKSMDLHLADQRLADHWRGRRHATSGLLERVLHDTQHVKDVVLATPLENDLGPQLVVLFEPTSVVGSLEPSKPGFATVKKLRSLVASPKQLMKLFDGEPHGFEGVFRNDREGEPVAEYRDAMVVSYGGQGPRPAQVPASALAEMSAHDEAGTQAATGAKVAVTQAEAARQLQTEQARESLEDQREELEQQREVAAKLAQRERDENAREQAQASRELRAHSRPEEEFDDNAYLMDAWGLNSNHKMISHPTAKFTTEDDVDDELATVVKEDAAEEAPEIAREKKWESESSAQQQREEAAEAKQRAVDEAEVEKNNEYWATTGRKRKQLEDWIEDEQDWFSADMEELAKIHAMKSVAKRRVAYKGLAELAKEEMEIDALDDPHDDRLYDLDFINNLVTKPKKAVHTGEATSHPAKAAHAEQTAHSAKAAHGQHDKHTQHKQHPQAQAQHHDPRPNHAHKHAHHDHSEAPHRNHRDHVKSRHRDN